MGGRSNSLTRRIRSAVATWYEFCFEFRRKTKTIAFYCDFVTTKFKGRPEKKNQDFTLVCAIVVRQTEMKTKTKRFYLTILLFAILLCDICFLCDI